MAKSRTKISQSRRRKVFERDKYTCQYCGKKAASIEEIKGMNGKTFIRLNDSDNFFPFEIDHIIPVCKGGKNDIENLTTSCNPCNNRKGGKHESN